MSSPEAKLKSLEYARKHDRNARSKWNAIVEILSKLHPGMHVLYVDESDLHLLPQLRATWSRIGEQVSMPTPGTDQRKSLYGALNVRTGAFECWAFDGKRAESSIVFLEQLLKVYPTGTLCIILDNFSSHKARIVQEWLARHHRVRLLFLPAYTPHMNTVERVWWRPMHRTGSTRTWMSSWKL